MELKQIVEGATVLYTPCCGGVSKDEEVFYNPHMELNRDVSVVLSNLLQPGEFLDSMAASGARGVRVANEAGVEAILNDLNPKAVELCEKNAKANDIRATITSDDVRRVFAERRYDFVDLDPFGTPAPFMDSASQAVRFGGILGVAATDTSALCGSHPRACARKYDATPLRCDCYAEVGLRILIGFIARTFLRHHLGMEAVFSHATRHYMRVQATPTRGYRESMKSIGYIQYCFKCLFRGYESLEGLRTRCDCGGELRTAGPLWTAGFAHQGICSDMAKFLDDSDADLCLKKSNLVERLREEQGTNVPFYNLHKICKKAGVPSPRMEHVRETIEDAGCFFSRTHFEDTGFRTDLGICELSDIVKNLRNA